MILQGLDFGVLGPLRVRVNGQPAALGTPKQSAVLALLLINRNRPVPRDSIIAALWDEDSPQADAIHNLHVYVANLRKVLGTSGVEPKTVLASARPGYQLNVPDAACDLGRFNTEKAAGVQAAAGRFGLAGDRLSAALAQWRGPVLDNLREFRFVQSFATALVEDKVAAHVVRAESEIACGRRDSVIGELEELVAEHPYREPLWTQLITAYYAAERQTDALDAYRRLRSVLSDELGIEPGPTLRTLEQRILRQEPLDVAQIAQNDASEILTTLERRTTISGPAGSTRAQLRDAAGCCYPLETVTTGIGRRADNGVVLDDPRVSRYHATIIDTGVNFVINDPRSANGVKVSDQRIRGSATLSHGDVVSIGGYQFTFELAPADSPAQ